MVSFEWHRHCGRDDGYQMVDRGQHRRKKPRKAKKQHKTWAKKDRLYRSVGYAWVFAFLFWSVPKWEYGKVYCAIV